MFISPCPAQRISLLKSVVIRVDINRNWSDGTRIHEYTHLHQQLTVDQHVGISRIRKSPKI